MLTVYGSDSATYDFVVTWKKNFPIGHVPITDNPKCGRPQWKNWWKDGRVIIRMIMNATHLSFGSALKIILEEVHMSKVFACSVPRLLIDPPPLPHFKLQLKNLNDVTPYTQIFQDNVINSGLRKRIIIFLLGNLFLN